MDSVDSHFNLSLTVKDKVTRQCPQTTTSLKRKLGEPTKWNQAEALLLYQPNALPLGQTGSQVTFVSVNIMFMYSDTPVEKTATKIWEKQVRLTEADAGMNQGFTCDSST